MLGAYPELNVIGDAENAAAAFAVISRLRPDVIFLDINMPGRSGFDLLQSLDYSPHIIFTTAHSEYAIRSFDFNTIDYLLKPISRERLDKAIAKLPLVENDTGDVNELLDIRSKIFIKDGGRCHLIDLADIHLFESCKNHAIIHFEKGKTAVKKSLNTIEQRLPSQHFFRVSRQYIVNLSIVASIDEWVNDGFKLTLSTGKEIEVSRRHATRLKELLSI
jgi:two-component system LytT family response regulator